MKKHDSNENVPSSTLRNAEVYLRSNRWVGDSMLGAATSQIVGVVATIPCCGWCTNSEQAAWIARDIGNDMTKTMRAHQQLLNKAIETACNKCADKYFSMAEALRYHMEMLDCISRKDNQGCIQAARTRGRILQDIGFKLA